MPDPTDKRIEELRQYTPPYTAPNHPPQVEVITTTNTGDTPMTEEPDIVERLRNYNTCSDTDVDEAADEIERLRNERDEARRETCYELSGWKQSTHEQEARAEAKRRGWDCFKEDSR